MVPKLIAVGNRKVTIGDRNVTFMFPVPGQASKTCVFGVADRHHLPQSIQLAFLILNLRVELIMQ